MASIIDYIKKYGNKSFEEEPLNEVDNALFSFLSYFNFDGIIDNSGRKVLLSDAIYQFFELHDPKVLRTHGIGLKDSYRLAKVLMEKKRYKDLPLYNYVYKTDEEVQFSSICIDLNDKLTYISIEGTDDEVVAWKEDFEMAYMFPVPAQKMCIDYLKNNVKFLSNKKYIIGGHSKGGNLALVGTMYLPFFKRMKVKSIWSFDGPGLNDEQINSKEYNRVKDKYHFYLPNYSIVGMMLNNRAEMNVVKASNVTIKSHSIYYWMTTDNKFTREPGQRHVSPMRGTPSAGRGNTTRSGSGPACDANETNGTPSRIRVHSTTSPSTSRSSAGRSPPRRAFNARMRARASSARNATSAPSTKSAGSSSLRAPQPHAARNTTTAK